MLLSGEESDMVLGLADEFGLTVSDVVRQLIRAEYQRMSNPHDSTRLDQPLPTGPHDRNDLTGGSTQRRRSSRR